jgi:hypothetical protein
MTPGRPINTARRKPKRRLRISAGTWSAIAAFTGRERTILMETVPTSPRINPSLTKLRFLEQEVAR